MHACRLARWCAARPAAGVRGSGLALAVLFALAGCDGCQGSEPEPVSAPAAPEADAPGSAPSPSRVFAPERGPQAGDAQVGYRILPAFVPDHPPSARERIPARRLVYRVALTIPEAFGPRRRPRVRPSTELVVDVSQHRLRARFEGAGWPVADGAEVRLRRDQPGVYVFDARGGRALGPGQMASWFEGGRLRRDPYVRVRPPPSDERTGPGNLVCRLLAEWGNHPTEPLEGRCGEGGSPPLFRLGPWRAERTADVAVERRWTALRADHVEPPRRPGISARRLLVSAPRFGRLEPFFASPEADRGPHALTIQHGGKARALIVIEGMPVRWLGKGATERFAPLEAGMYRVGAMRPLGAAVMRSDRVRVPGTLTLSR